MTKDEIKAAIEKYNINQYCRRVGYEIIYEDIISADCEISETDTYFDKLRDHKTEIIEYLNEKRAEEQRLSAEKKARIDSIEGLSKLRLAVSSFHAWKTEIERYDKNRVSERIPAYERRLSYINEIKKKYPCAAAYLRIKSLMGKPDCAISAIGRKALVEIEENPSDYERIIKRVDAEIGAARLKRAGRR